MRFRPDKRSVQKFDSFQSFDIFQTNCKKFCTFKLTKRPWWPLVPIAVSAMMQRETLGDAFCDINLTLKAVDARVGTIGLCHNTTDAAAYHSILQD